MDELYLELKELIESHSGQKGLLFEAGAFSGLGWYFFHYKCSTFDGPYPRVSLKQQKNAVHVYTALWDNGKSVLEDYVGIFGKSGVGKGCLRIRKLTPARRQALIEILGIAKAKS